MTLASSKFYLYFSFLVEAECIGGLCSKCRGREDKLRGPAEDLITCRGREDKLRGSAEDLITCRGREDKLRGSAEDQKTCRGRGD